MDSMPVAKYRITGLVDMFDEQGVARGQFPIGSEQELPVHIGERHVADGNAELIDGSEREVEVEEAPVEGATAPAEEVQVEGATAPAEEETAPVEGATAPTGGTEDGDNEPEVI